MTPTQTFLWHDYETSGIHPALDRPVQFAAIRTDASLNPIGEPLEWFCAPAMDSLPHPGACLVTGITPQAAREKGLPEVDFAGRIHDEMMQPQTCSAGFNNIRFDDEFSRHLFYRNFFDAYEREWRNGNSRWDLIDLVRMCYALRPEGIEWPLNDGGNPSFRLEDLASANGIEQRGAHDALVDVRATIELARLVRERQPRLFEWGLGMSKAANAMKLLDLANPAPVVHTSSKIPAGNGCTSLFLPLAVLPDRKKSVIAVDLAQDPSRLVEASAELIADLVFTPALDLPDDMERIRLKAIHTNKVPMLAPIQVLKDVDTSRIGLDVQACLRHAELLIANLEHIRYKVMEVFRPIHDDSERDPDLMLYSGGFFPDSDRAVMKAIHNADPAALGEQVFRFADPRMPEMLFRFRARNYPESLSPGDAQRWEEFCAMRIMHPPVHGYPGFEELLADLRSRRNQAELSDRDRHILDELEAWYMAVRPSPG